MAPQQAEGSRCTKAILPGFGGAAGFRLLCQSSRRRTRPARPAPRCGREGLNIWKPDFQQPGARNLKHLNPQTQEFSFKSKDRD